LKKPDKLFVKGKCVLLLTFSGDNSKTWVLTRLG